MKQLKIRQENRNDHESIYHLVKEAFSHAEHADGNEQDLVNALRGGTSYIPELALVAEVDGEIVGHIMFTKARVGNSVVLVLAPLSVKVPFQRQGIGTALINEGHKIARQMGYQYAMVLGSEYYYPRAGYVPAAELGVEVPEGIPSKNFMGIRLKEEAAPISGKLIYAEEFGI